MDNNFSDILKTFRQLNEGYHDNTISAMAAAKYEPQVGDSIRTRKGGQVPGTVEKIEGDRVYFRHPEGKLYRTHASNVMRSMEEAIISPQGMSTQQPNAQPNPQDAAKDLNTAQKNLNQLTPALKAGGVNLPSGVTQAAKTAVATVQNPAQAQTPQDRKITGALGQGLAQVVAKGDSSQIGQLKNMIQKIEQGGGA